MFFVPEEFVPVAFDSGGITTGTISIPFIMTLGIGLTEKRTDKKAQESSFGLVSLCSIGPIITMLLLGLIYPYEGGYEININETINVINTSACFRKALNHAVIFEKSIHLHPPFKLHLLQSFRFHQDLFQLQFLFL